MTEQTEEQNGAGTDNADIEHPATIQCGKLLNIASVSELQRVLLSEIKDKKVITIDTTNPERIDTAGIQLLCSLVNEAQSHDASIVWEEEIPDKLRAIATQLGLDNHLGPGLSV